MSVMIYRVTGRARIGMRWQRFSLELLASKPSEAIEKTYSDLGSRHKLKRSMIKIEEVREVSKDEIKHSKVSQLMYIEALVKW